MKVKKKRVEVENEGSWNEGQEQKGMGTKNKGGWNKN